jgi:two-component system response regulator MprA
MEMEEKKRILVVDDDKVVRESFKQILIMEGYSVDVAETGRQALEKIMAEFFTLVLVNNRLPDMSGKELQNKIQASMLDQRVILLGSEPLDPMKLLNLIKEDR